MTPAQGDNRSVDLAEAMSAENDRLRLQVARLEARVREYERTMTDLQNSKSWRATTPLRLAAGRTRRLRLLVSRSIRSLASQRREPGAPLRGLFPASIPRPREFAINRPAEWCRRARVLVIAHVHYPELWSELAERLAAIPEKFDLVVTVTHGQAELAIPLVRREFPHAWVQVVPNRGRDQAPLAMLAGWGLLDGYVAVLKIHTKRSMHRIDGDAWRRSLLDGVLASPDESARIIELLASEPDVGLVVPAGNVRGPEHWGSNLESVTRLAERLCLAFDPERLRFPAGSMYWAASSVLSSLALLGLGDEDFEPEAGHTDGSMAHALERFVGIAAQQGGREVITTDEVATRLQRSRSRRLARRGRPAARTLAFYLPQYHRVRENDEWWGEGFTDWVNVRAARPLFRGHRQPMRPGPLGHYDLADPETLRAQAALMRQRGIDGLVLYHYWFDGTRLLDVPLRNLLADDSIDLPFALCWANEPWTRRWDGRDDDVLQPQSFSSGWVDRFYEDCLPAWQDPRHIRVSGKPLLVVYRLGLLPDAVTAVSKWKSRAAADGLAGLHVLGVMPGRGFEPLPAGIEDVIDGLIGFPPMSRVALVDITEHCPDLVAGFQGQVFSYESAVDGSDLSPVGPRGLRVHPGVMPGWDNTPRRGPAGYVFHGSNPLSYQRWLSRAVAAAEASLDGEPLVFVNAWNEWAEGAVLEGPTAPAFLTTGAP